MSSNSTDSATDPKRVQGIASPVFDNEGFSKLWSSFYDQAVQVASSKSAGDKKSLDHHEKRVLSLLDAMTKLIFGLDEAKKSIAVNHGMGSIELIIQLVQSTTATESPLTERKLPVLLGGLKATKCCLVRNKVGRTRCRSARAFEYVSLVLEHCLQDTNSTMSVASMAPLVEEALTTLAAMCLGDDLNALRGAVQMRHFVDAAARTYPKEKYSALHQKITYLVALFIAIEKEQETLIEHIKGNPGYFDTLSQSEVCFRKGMDCMQQPSEALEHYNEALQKVESLYTSTTPPSLLENLVCQLHEKQCAVRLELEDYTGALDNANAMLEFKLSTELTAQVHVYRARALRGLGKTQEAKEAVAQALIASPGNEELTSMMEKLDVVA